jgi:hypothetical protein
MIRTLLLVSALLVSLPALAQLPDFGWAVIRAPGATKGARQKIDYVLKASKNTAVILLEGASHTKVRVKFLFPGSLDVFWRNARRAKWIDISDCRAGSLASTGAWEAPTQPGGLESRVLTYQVTDLDQCDSYLAVAPELHFDRLDESQFENVDFPSTTVNYTVRESKQDRVHR